MMIEEQPLEQIGKDVLLSRVGELAAGGHRLVQISCTRLPDGFELTYSFDLEQKMRHLRVTLPAADIDVPSITSVYGCAFTYENEIHDLFGVNVQGLDVDFKGSFYRMAVKTPYAAPEKASSAGSGEGGAHA